MPVAEKDPIEIFHSFKEEAHEEVLEGSVTEEDPPEMFDNDGET